MYQRYVVPMDSKLSVGYNEGAEEVSVMHNEFTAITERDGQWYFSYCPEIPGANGQGKTKDEARESLAQAIALILEDRREDGLRGVPPDAIRETVTIT
jgi:predicted RNase H-like HicB family nuclease